MDTTSTYYAMSAALDLAREAAEAGEVPVGAVVLDADGRIIGRGRNLRETDGDPLAHAEVLAIRKAARNRRMLQNNLQKTHVMRIDDSRISGNEMNGEISADDADIEDSADSESAGENRNVSMENAWNLADCTLVVTLEPCPMCAGAALQTHIGCIVFGAWDAKLGACGSVWDIPRDPHVGARPEIIGGLREAECAGLLAQFFACRR